MKDNTFAEEVGRRLQETAWEFGYRTQQDFADWIGATRPQVYTWYRGLALPPVKYMQKLAAHGITLDWIYRGVAEGLPYPVYIRLHAAMSEGRPLQDVGPEPEPQPLQADVAARVADKLRDREAPPTRRKRARAA